MVKGEAEVVIVGGGLAGLALAVGLQHRNISCHVYESRSELGATHGNFMGVCANGVAALKGIHPDLPSHMAKEGAYLSRLSFSFYNNGHVLNSGAMDYKQGECASVSWSQAQRALAKNLNPASISFSHKLISYCPASQNNLEEGATRVEARFMKKKEDVKEEVVVTCKLLIGADGIWSSIRRQMVGDPARYLHLMAWSAIVEDPDLSLFPGLQRGEVRFRFDGGGQTRCVISNAGDYTLWLLRKRDDDESLANTLDNRRARIGKPGTKAEALAQLDGVQGWDDLKHAIQLTDESAISQRLSWDRIPIDKWSDLNGHVLLIGDGAHALYSEIGQGSRTAFEDAHQLSDLLISARNDDSSGYLNGKAIEAAVKRFDEIRIPRMKKFHGYASYETMVPLVQPEWAKNLTLPESQRMAQEFQMWIATYPHNQTSFPTSTYFKDQDEEHLLPNGHN